MKFTPDRLQTVLRQMPASASAVVALSGGLDSVVLLHSLVQLRDQSLLPFTLCALHINHGLHAQAGDWQRHCKSLCQALAVPFSALTVAVGDAEDTEHEGDRSGIENAARSARYQAFEGALKPGETLLLAHHRDDQMETLLLRLLRGAGNRGLVGIPRSRELAAGFLFRPLLDFDRSDLLAYGRAQSLNWIEDDANANQRFDRNYCRHTLLPLIEARWPGFRSSWNKTATLAAESESLLQELAQLDLQQAQTAGRCHLALDVMRQLSRPRQRNMLRLWLTNLGLPDPGWKQLHKITDEVIAAAPDSNASALFADFSVACYKNSLVALQRIPELDKQLKHDWNPQQRARLQLTHNGSLHARPMAASDAQQKLGLVFSGPLQVRYRQGGESCQLRGRPRKSVKKLLQEHAIAPWQRARYPLLYVHDELVCLPGIGVVEDVTNSHSGSAWLIEWQQPSWQLAPD